MKKTQLANGSAKGSRGVLIIGTSENEKTHTSITTLLREYALGAGQPIAVFFCLFDELSFDLGAGQTAITDLRNSRDIKEYGAVYIRGKLAPILPLVGVVARYARANGVMCANAAYEDTPCVNNKVAQAYALAAGGYAHPHAIFASNDRLIELAEAVLPYPMILKSVSGAHGNNNYLAKSSGEAGEIIKQHSGVRFLAQAYVPNDGDYRVLVAGKHRHVVIKRQAADGSHLNSISQGATGVLLNDAEVPAGAIDMAHSFAQACKLDIAGVDMIVDSATGAAYVLEINSQPQLLGEFKVAKAELLGSYFSEAYLS